uniref:F-Box protein n=1 Tax=Solanum tuberosum TaxID=4113 RepID=M1DY45_SOLTU
MAKKLFLWNPTIRKYRKSSYFKTKVGNVVHIIYGFGYDEIHDDYKVVSICTNIGHQHDFQEVNIYSLKNDSWRRIYYPQNETRLISSGKFVNVKLHWATSVGLGYERGWSITSFDLADEKWGKVE